ncbi:MAG: glycoside hydrolase family 57 protein, partial [Bradymonadaceae bacterium]
MTTPNTRLLFLWHFHQPYYSTPGRTSNTLPWVRLHAIKSYYDMGRMLEDHPEIRCVVNFSGSLLEQLREYLEVGKRDSWWHLTKKPAANLNDPDKLHLLKHFFSIDWETCIEPLPGYRKLLEKRGTDSSDLDISAFSTQEYRDLQVLFNLAWFGFSARNERAVIQSLLEKGEKFSEDEKVAVLEQQVEVMQLLIPLYRRLHQRGQIEICVSPMYHPIMPLVIDTDTSERCSPGRPRPERFQAPEDAEYHIREAHTIVRDVLGVDADGMWPSEGAISPETLEMFDDHGVSWCASDQEVLEKSRGDDWKGARDLYRPWQLEGIDTDIFFRDRALSDQIGFVYGNSDTHTAVDDFMDRLRGVRDGVGDESPVVSVILDGENPWEHYPNDGEEFLGVLFDRITDAEDVETVTPSQSIEESERESGQLESLHSGSWIHANYDIWIGHDETNRAWDLLGQ